MKKRVFRWIVLAVLAMLMLGCTAKKTLHCDGCGKEIKVPADSATTEDWILLCDDCQKKLYGTP